MIGICIRWRLMEDSKGGLMKFNSWGKGEGFIREGRQTIEGFTE